MHRYPSHTTYAKTLSQAVPMGFPEPQARVQSFSPSRLSPGNMFWDDTADLRDFEDALPTMPASLYAELHGFKHN